MQDQRGLRHGVQQLQTAGVQQQARGRVVSRAVQGITHDGVTECQQVHAQLVRASGDGLYAEAAGA